MAYIESSLMMFRGESHKLLSARIPDESGNMTTGTYGMVCRDGQIIWEILGRRGRQIVMPISLYENYTYRSYTFVIDIDKGCYILQGSVGQEFGRNGFIANDNGIMVMNYYTLYSKESWCNLSVNGAVFYNPNYGRKLEGSVIPWFGMGDSFYGVGVSGYELENKLLKLTVDKHGMVENEEVVDEIDGITRAVTIKYKGFDFCILTTSDNKYYTFNLKNYGLNLIKSDIFTINALRWLTDGKFAYLRTDGSAIYVVITSNIDDAEDVIYADSYGYNYSSTYISLYCRYPYVYVWRRYRATSSDSYVLRIIKINVVTGERQVIEPDSIIIGDVMFRTKESDSIETRYYKNLWNNTGIFWSNQEYFDDGVLKDDLQGGYGVIEVNTNGSAATYRYAIYMDNLELQPSENNMAIWFSNW